PGQPGAGRKTTNRSQEQQARDDPRRQNQEGDPTSMSSVRLEAVNKHQDSRDIPMQPASADIWDKKYRLKTKAGDAVDADIDGTYQRVAKALAERSEEHTSELQ